MKIHLSYILLSCFFIACTSAESPDDSDSAEGNVTPIQNTEMSGDYVFIDKSLESYGTILSWDGDFTNEEKEKVTNWIADINTATNKTLGQYRFDVYVTIMRSESKNRPVPFGFARRRSGRNEVHLYVNPAASYDELMLDWTAQHEFSHLSIPFLGKKNKWFSEGFATFLSRQIMLDQGLFTQTEFDSLYHSKITESKTAYNSSTKTFIEVSDSLLENHNYAYMYWGSSTFLFTIDKRLREERNMRFVDIMKEYQLNYRDSDKYIKDVIQSFDKVIGEDWCWDLMIIYRNALSYKVMENY
jgi:hypothetical protein